MDEPGSGSSHPEIIDRRDIKSRWRIFFEGLLTLAFWSGFLYLLAPVATILLWYLGFKFGYAELVGAEGLKAFSLVLTRGGVLVLIITLLIIGWSYYNYMWFRIRGERRNSRASVCFEQDFCKLYNIDLEVLQKAKKEKSLRVYYMGDNFFTVPCAPPPEPPMPRMCPQVNGDEVVLFDPPKSALRP